jgi:hypothetical protein
MNNKKTNDKYISPPADIILDLINGEDNAPHRLLNHYDEYTTSRAKEPVYNEHGKIITTVINDDLLQDIREDILKAIPTLRRSILNGSFTHRPLVVIVAANSEIFE